MLDMRIHVITLSYMQIHVIYLKLNHASKHLNYVFERLDVYARGSEGLLVYNVFATTQYI